jgi:AraC-like DNA-binding protein
MSLQTAPGALTSSTWPADAQRRGSSFDLRSVARSQREMLWRQAARSFFPGVTVRGCEAAPDLGSIEGGSFGPGSMWTVLTPSVSVAFRPQDEAGAPPRCFTLLLQLRGTMAAAQRERHCRLRPGDLCLMDEAAPFSLDVHEGTAQFILLRMPRWMVVDRYPRIGDRTAFPLDGERPAAALVRRLLEDLHRALPHLDEQQGDVALGGVVQLLGLLGLADAPAEGRRTAWRARLALSYIDARLADPALTAREVAAAQGIGRRHLDEILLRDTGASVSAQIWQRRLAKAALDLRSPQLADRSVAAVARGAGFECAAHFARAFRKRYRCTPREWRLRRSGSSALPS